MKRINHEAVRDSAWSTMTTILAILAAAYMVIWFANGVWIRISSWSW